MWWQQVSDCTNGFPNGCVVSKWTLRSITHKTRYKVSLLLTIIDVTSWVPFFNVHESFKGLVSCNISITILASCHIHFLPSPKSSQSVSPSVPGVTHFNNVHNNPEVFNLEYIPLAELWIGTWNEVQFYFVCVCSQLRIICHQAQVELLDATQKKNQPKKSLLNWNK